MSKQIKMLGQKYNRLTVIKEVEGDKVNRPKVVCICECETILTIDRGNVLSGHTKSCGCMRSDNHYIKHGGTKSKTYYVWWTMKQRCVNPKVKNYDLYGGRGISYTPRWEEFENFLEDMGEKPEGLTLDRVDVNGNYCKENCRWASYSLQGYNQRLRSTNKSGKTGVWWCKRGNCWQAYIYKDGHKYNLGKFQDYSDAVKARVSAEMKFYGFIVT